MLYNMIGTISETMTIVRLSLERFEDDNKILRMVVINLYDGGTGMLVF
jgi:hypothetical protein